MSEKETLSFKIGLSGTYHDKVPEYTVLLDGVKQASGTVGESGVTGIVEFSAEIDDSQEHVLSIRFENKTDDQTVKDDNTKEDFIIVKDMLLNIDSIEIDEIDIGTLKWSKSEFVDDDTTMPVMLECVNLGRVGSYNLKFTSPFYIWLLENT